MVWAQAARRIGVWRHLEERVESGAKRLERVVGVDAVGVCDRVAYPARERVEVEHV